MTDYAKRLDELAVFTDGSYYGAELQHELDEAISIARELLKERDELASDNAMAAKTIRDLMDEAHESGDDVLVLLKERDGCRPIWCTAPRFNRSV